jgi:hypothetical protein
MVRRWGPGVDSRWHPCSDDNVLGINTLSLPPHGAQVLICFEQNERGP